jgi:hypothetical protein
MLRRIVIGLVLVFLAALPATAQNLEKGLAAFKGGDYAAARGQLLPLARGGNPVSQSYLGLIYHHGLGVKADLEIAIDWYGKAANNGEPMAQRILGDLHVAGVSGAPDYAAARQWYEAAANGGDAEAQQKLRELNRAGRGVSREPDSAAPRRRSSRNKKRGRNRTASLRRPSSCMSGMPDAPYHVDVRIEFPAINFDHTRSIAELGKISGAGHGSRILGLMKPDMRLKTLPKAQGMSNGNQFCFWVNGFEIVLRYSQIDVYVAKEYPVGSCNYKATLEHEMEHVEVARRNLERFAPKIRDALESGNIPTAQTPIIVANAAEATRDVRAISEENLKGVYISMVRALRKAQGKVDSPQSYARVFRRCPKW